jgi:hypothetical protein|tara:strand:+ start:3289 stop:3741 length:453 start_codon:yes stop_codon:yes gene_type:complete
MAFNGNFMCTSFKKELLYGAHDFDASSGDTFKIALYTNSATLNASTTAYANTNEVSGTNYTAGGQALNPVDPTSSGTTALLDFADETWANATITARGALIYNTTPNTTSISLTNPAVIVLDFGGDKTSTAGNFTVVFPTADASNAIIRIA